jgi:hypothetical protein
MSELVRDSDCDDSEEACKCCQCCVASLLLTVMITKVQSHGRATSLKSFAGMYLVVADGFSSFDLSSKCQLLSDCFLNSCGGYTLTPSATCSWLHFAHVV